MPEKEKHTSVKIPGEETNSPVVSWSANLEHLMRAATEVGIVSTDAEGKVVFYNSGAENLFGYSKEEVVGKPYPLYAHEKEEITAYLKELSEEYGGTGVTPWIRKIDMLGVDRKEWTYIRKDGSRMIGSLTLTLVKTPQNEIVGILGIVVDITRQKKAEQELQKLNDQLEKKVWERTQSLREVIRETRSFAYIVSHDLRVPLVNIRGFTGELKLSIEEFKQALEAEKHKLSDDARQQLSRILDEDMEEAFGFIEGSAMKMAQMINSILKLSRMGRRNLEASTIQPNAFVQNVLKQFAHTLENNNIEIKVSKLPSVTADAISLEQIFANLIQNAILYSRPNTKNKIEISGEKLAFETHFYVTDKGIGIEAKDQARIFDLFSRAGRSVAEGEGMGLAFVRALVKRHGGKVWCESTPGKGSKFGFSISDPLPENWSEDNV